MKIEGMKTIEVFFGESWEEKLFGELLSEDENPEDDNNKVLTLKINVNQNGTLSIPLNS